MTTQTISNKLISLNPQEMKFLLELLRKEGKSCRKSFLAIGRWTDSLTRHVNTLQDILDKLEEVQNVEYLDKRMAY